MPTMCRPTHKSQRKSNVEDNLKLLRLKSTCLKTSNYYNKDSNFNCNFIYFAFSYSYQLSTVVVKNNNNWVGKWIKQVCHSSLKKKIRSLLDVSLLLFFSTGP